MLQPKIGVDFSTQYGGYENLVASSTMANASMPSSQFYNTARVTQNSNPEKIAENISKYETAQGNYMRAYYNL